MKSGSIKEIALALNKFQGSIEAVQKDASNPFYNSTYATLDCVWEAIRTPLKAEGLSVSQVLDNDDGRPVVETVLMHTSGEWISGRYPLKAVKEDPQAYGSAITYARRYALCGMLGIVADEDDDANMAGQTKIGKQSPKKQEDNTKGHWCVEHKTLFFKKGNMKAYAHPIANTKDWCHEHKEKPATEPPADTIPQADAQDAQKIAPKQTQKGQRKEGVVDSEAWKRYKEYRDAHSDLTDAMATEVLGQAPGKMIGSGVSPDDLVAKLKEAEPFT
jgi:hypothetical protein